MASQSIEAVKLLSRIEKSLRELIDEAGGSRVDLETNSIALAGRELCWVTVDDQRSLVRHSSALSFDVGDLRRAQADPRRGAGCGRICGWRLLRGCCIRSATGCVSR